MIACSFFNCANDNRPRAFAGSLSELKALLETAHHPRHGLSGHEAKLSLPAICGAVFKPGKLRARENVLSVGVTLFDFDNSMQEPSGEYWPNARTGLPTNRPKLQKVMLPDPVTFEAVQEALWNAGVVSFSWSTWSSAPAWPKFRVVVPLETPIPFELWESASEWILDRLGFAPYRRGLDLPVLHNAAALGFLAGAPDPASIRFGATAGTPLAVPLDGLTFNPVSLPLDPWQEAIQATRKAAKDAGKHWFQCYRVGGKPVDFKALDLPAVLRSHGIKVGSERPYKGGSKWRCSCPWSSEHSGGVDDDAAVIISTPGQFPAFQCRHSSHLHLGLQDVLASLWGGAA